MATPGDDWLPLGRASAAAGVNARTLGRWVAAGKLRARRAIVNGLPAKLVSVAEVRRLVGEGVRPGRPPAKRR